MGWAMGRLQLIQVMRRSSLVTTRTADGGGWLTGGEGGE